ncbi:MAG TPA: bifunctional diaminohydroxyphosphoribosylaminopyrimidine deaminase/5-amino-6-(5-phosphoribosylamino)uracil reductase RibD, partial [Thermoanaerobaculia bacterium]
TLEPCCHHGRTGPCAEAIAEAGIAHVVVAMLDPHEVVDGGGIARLAAANVDVTTGVLEAEARRLNEVFVWSVTQKLPFVILKAGMTVDGKMATVTRESQWITSEGARERSLMLREQCDAILIGSGTVKADNPRLTRRLGLAHGIIPWTRVVLDGDGDLPEHAQLLLDGRTILFTGAPDRYDRRPDLEIVPTGGRVDLEQVLGELHARGIRSLVAEGGSVVHAELIRRALWQKMILFIAPMIIGGAEAPSIFSGEAVSRLTDAYRFRFDRAEFVGTDLMVTAYPA